MADSRKWMRIAGLVLHVLIAALMIIASSGKLLGSPPAEVMENLRKAGLDGQLKLIGAGELITGILLILPWTASLGVLLASGFWGGISARTWDCTNRTCFSRCSCADLGWSIPSASRDVQQLRADRSQGVRVGRQALVASGLMAWRVPLKEPDGSRTPRPCGGPGGTARNRSGRDAPASHRLFRGRVREVPYGLSPSAPLGLNCILPPVSRPVAKNCRTRNLCVQIWVNSIARPDFLDRVSKKAGFFVDGAGRVT